MSNRISALLILALLSGCSDSSAENQLAAEKKTFASTAASVEMMAGEWLSGTVPHQFADRALKAGNEELADHMGRAATYMVRLQRDPQPLLQAMDAVLSSAAKTSADLSKEDYAALNVDFAQLKQAVANFRNRGGS